MGAELIALAAMLLAASGVFLGLSAIKKAKALELRVRALEEGER